MLTLCGYDTFETIKKFCDTYVGKETSGGEYDHVLEQLRQKERALEQLDSDIEDLKDTLQKLEHRRTSAKDEKENMLNGYIFIVDDSRLLNRRPSC